VSVVVLLLAFFAMMFLTTVAADAIGNMAGGTAEFVFDITVFGALVAAYRYLCLTEPAWALGFAVLAIGQGRGLVDDFRKQKYWKKERA
jgi:hypothetical protein